MEKIKQKEIQFRAEIKEVKKFFEQMAVKERLPIKVFTHLDADGLTSGAILGKALYREEIPFQIRVLKQLEREEIIRIKKELHSESSFLIFSDFGSGQYLELVKQLKDRENPTPFLILDHHLPQEVSSKEEKELLKNIYDKTKHWHLNPYFFGIDGSIEISGAGMCYYFSKGLNPENVDLSHLAVIGAIGDVQNQGPNRTFIGLNTKILEDAINAGYLKKINDLNFSPIKPINEAIAYSSDIDLPGLSGEPNKTLKFLKKLAILMENSDGTIRTLNDLNWEEKQKISSALIEFATIKLDINPGEIIDKLIVNRYKLKQEDKDSELYDANEFSNLLNACGRTDQGSLGIAIGLGDREKAYRQAKENLISHKKNLVQAMEWIKKKGNIKETENVQYFFGKDKISEKIVGTIASMLIFNNSNNIDINKPIFGLARRKDEKIYKISGRAHEILVEKGLNLSKAIRTALELSNINSLGGGHPPAAGTKIPIEKTDIFLKNIDKVIKNQLKK